jgi:class 3 adenylate cyclase
MTTEHVAVLFTDVVRSTELAATHSPEEADEIRRTHFSILRQAIALTGGTELKHLGDGVMVVFGSASSALTCAVVMQQTVELDNRRCEHSVGLRVGLSGGEVAHEEEDYFGDPVVEAARLCAACQGGQILASDVVRLMAGRRNRHQCKFFGAVPLKGLPHPVDTVEVIWEPLDGGGGKVGIPLPERLGVHPETGVVGRAPELKTLADAATRTAIGEGRQVILVSGEAGLGKTTLVAEAARRAYQNGACVLFGHCEEGLATPYQLFAEALGHYITHATEDQLLAHVGVHGSELNRLVPMLASRIPDLPPTRATDADSERFLLFAAMVGLIAHASAEQPIFLVLDDLQWADEGSLHLLQHLTAAVPPMRVLVLGIYRDDELDLSHPFLDTFAALSRERGVSRIELTGMDDMEVLAFMSAAGYALDDAIVDLARAIYRETDGNPFFVCEVLRHLAETGVVRQDKTGPQVADDSFEQIALPDTIRKVIRARIGRLGREAGRVLAVAAVIGRDFDLDLLAMATETPEDKLLEILDAAAAASLVRELTDGPGRYHFTHSLIQYAVYQDLGPTRQAKTHRVVALALEELCGDRPGPRVSELARHWGNTSQAIDIGKAIQYLQQAGDAAFSALAPADALHYYVDAVALTGQLTDSNPMLEIDLAIGLATAQRQTGDPAFRETLLDAARRALALGDTDRLVAASLANDRGWYTASGVVDSEKVELLELALERLPAVHPDRALVLGTLCAELAFGSTLEHRQALADEALAIVESTGDDAEVVRTLNHLVFPFLVPSLLEQSLAWSADALTRAKRVRDPVLLYFAAMYRATVATRAGDIEEVDRCYAIAGPLVRQLNQPSLNWEYTFHLAKRAQIAGNIDEAEQLATKALHIGTDGGQPDAVTFYGVQLAVVNWQRGTLGDLAPLIEQMIVETPGLPTLKASLAVAYTEDDRPADAHRLLAEFAATGFDLPPDAAWLNGMTEYAEAAIACGDPDFAEPLLEQLAPWTNQFSSAGGVTAEGPVSLVLGGLATVLERYDDAERDFIYASAFNDRVGARFFAARTALLWGQMLAARGGPTDYERASELVSRAQSDAATHGYRGIERRATAILESLS